MARGTQQMQTTNRVRSVLKAPERQETDDVDMGYEDVIAGYAQALPKPPMFKGSTKAERRVFMSAYDLYINQTYALSANGPRPFVMPVGACMDFKAKYRIAVWDLGKDPDEVTEEELAAWFRLGFEIEPRAFESLKKRVKKSICFDMSISDAESRVGKMLDGLVAEARRDRQEWILKEEA
ncbi:hypothetical protein H310_14366 [Aphanomyces invadans]|uniref:Uncharacterized protein n=1 Tax=Aphanomyces invadans TaxID=157072 RepID=A0A024TCB4_9STRA|nr:hypothetical protein H310_14366 [Aphanomyces invadans]ETV90952.1 hypothetical protein H310_14366 [Aphanomyces invadans]|eukprot:XP_008880434.1 hypothetical protein H310_14366 [Aphanomyces invadans]